MDGDFEKFNEEAELLKILAHPVRLCIVKGLIGKGKCNVGHMQDCLGIPQSTVSSHLQKLRAAKIIEGDRDGLEINYKVVNEKAVKIINALFEK